MAYIGRGIENFSQIEVLDNITFTNSAGPYNILKSAVAFIPSTVNSLLIEVDGIIQAPSSYTVDGSTITFGVSMASTSTMNSMIHFGTGLITTPADGSVTAAKIASDAVTTAKILDNNVTVAKLPTTLDISGNTVTLPASVSGLGTGITNAQLAGSIDVTSKITGVVPTANLGSGSASASTYLAGNQTYQTITAYNDDALQNDIATLALHQATNANAAKYNLANTNVDVYQDSTGIASFDDCVRDGTGEYVSTGIVDVNTVVLLHMNDVGLTDSSPNAIGTNVSGSFARSATQSKFGSYSAHTTTAGSGYFYTDSLAAVSNPAMATTGNWTLDGWFYPTAWTQYQRVINYGNKTSNRGGSGVPILAWTPWINTGGFNMYGNGDGSTAGATGGTIAALTGPTLNTWVHLAIQKSGTTVYFYYNGVIYNATVDATDWENRSMVDTDFLCDFGLSGRSGSTGEMIDGYLDEWRVSNIARYSTGSNGTTQFTPETSAYPDATVNATGNYVSTATTANASVSKVGIVMTYKNNEGTNALNTDIIAQVSADGGSNYTTCVLAAAGTFSTGVLQAVANDVSVTAGTSIQYKISFANQAAGSKEARITGVSLIY